MPEMVPFEKSLSTFTLAATNGLPSEASLITPLKMAFCCACKKSDVKKIRQMPVKRKTSPFIF
jgi:hypothetical protein